MNEDQKARVQALIKELDRLLPHTDAVVVMNVYGAGCDESQITATENGYLRLGIALMKAPFAPHFIESRGIQLDVSEQSDINFHLFQLDDTLKPDTPFVALPKPPWTDKVVGTACGFLCLLLLYVVAVGFLTIVQWIFR